MAVHVEQFFIEAFRGIRAFEAPFLNHVNLIVGDNNCGKTSLLEALLMLRSPASVANTLRVARQRDTAYVYNKAAIYDSFLALLPQYNDEQFVGIHAIYHGKPIDYRMQGVQTRIMLDAEDIQNFSVAGRRKSQALEAAAFKGELEWGVGGEYHVEPVRIHEYSKISGIEVSKSQLIEMSFLSPIDHVKNSILNNIVRNKDYKDICLHVIRMFDPDIEDLLLLKNEHTNRPVEYIQHRILGNMPISTYGDGIKKVLLLANSIVSAAGGILLIDEIDTAIHAKYFDKIFQFLITACARYEVQLFITTHNIEAVDAILATQNYEEQTSKDEVCVMTLKKGERRTYTRTMSGRDVYNNREAFGFEVRE